MKEWEDIFKENLEDCSVSLPEGSLEAFQRKVSSPRRTSSKRLAWLAVPVAAACAGLALLLPHRDGRGVMHDAVAVVQEAPAPAGLTAVDDVDTQNLASELFTDAIHEVTGAAATQRAVPVRKLLALMEEKTDAADAAVADMKESAPDTPETPQAVAENSQETIAEEIRENVNVSPVIPESKNVTWVGLETSPARRRHAGRVLKASGGVLGGATAGLLASAAGSLITKDASVPLLEAPLEGAAPVRPGLLMAPANNMTQRRDWMPWRAGITARYPLAERWYIVSGMEYTGYYSRKHRAMTGDENQYAHYLGIPVRIDWSAVKMRRLDLYMGAGASADICVSAKSGSTSLAREGVGASLVAAGGALLKFNDAVGLYMEPQLTWTPAASSIGPHTYRTDHPLMFSVSTGIRFTIGEK